MSATQNARQLLDEADRQRRIADAAESIRRNYRLGYGAAAKKGLFGLRRHGEEQWHPVNGDAAAALYDAALIVYRNALAEAERLEALVQVEEVR